MKIQIIGLFSQSLDNYFSTSMMRKASEIGAASFEMIDLRDFGLGPRNQVDDTPSGGGDGMVLMVEPLVTAIDHAKQTNPDAKVLLMTPRGETFKQSDAQGLADEASGLIIICGRYEGYDERIINWVDEQISVGNFVLTGGELAAAIVADAVVRLLPDVLGGDQSAEAESFADDQSREHPQYTKPADFQGHKIPDVLLSGNHAAIQKWRQDNQL